MEDNLVRSKHKLLSHLTNSKKNKNKLNKGHHFPSHPIHSTANERIEKKCRRQRRTVIIELTSKNRSFLNTTSLHGYGYGIGIRKMRIS